MRVTRLPREENRRGGFVLYHARGARRARANLALNYAIHLANERNLPLLFFETLDEPHLSTRTATFIREGIDTNCRDAESRGLGYAFGAVDFDAARLIVTDELPANPARVAHVVVDGNGILPMRAFAKEQYSAKFLRDRAHRLFPQMWANIDDAAVRVPWSGAAPAAAFDVRELAVPRVATTGGRAAGLSRLEHFDLTGYATHRNKSPKHTSGLSPYLHFGHLGIHEIAERALRGDAPGEDIEAFLEEAIIRRELSFNMCFYNPAFASLDALPNWAKQTLDKHRHDRRKPVYSYEELEAAETHDEVWNVSQRQLLETGTIHGYLRMLWGKKIIEWSPTPEDAHAAMVRMHDLYAIDGRDPNTHAGILWCFGKHDRPWAPERPIFGMVRWMSSEMTRKKVPALFKS